MKILLWYWGRRGGGARFAHALAAALARRQDVELSLSVSRQSHLLEEFRGLGRPCQEVDTYSGPLGFALGLTRVPRLAADLARQARDGQVDVVVSAMAHPWTPLVAPRLARAGIAYVPVVHDAQPHPGDIGQFWNWRLGRELDAARAAIALSDFVARALQARRPTLPLLRLPLGALLPPEPPAADAAVARTPGFTFLFFGRLRTYKGLDLLRDAFALLLARRPDARLVVVGEGKAEALAPGMATLPGVTVDTGWVPEAGIRPLLAAADAVVLPYREASQSAIAPIAYAAGLPVVATPVGGLLEQVIDGQTGLISSAVTPEALAEAMARMMEPALYARLATGAAAAGRALADWDSHADTLLAALREQGIGAPPGLA